ncbi:30S ribosomal protein S6 [Candidatus Gracilibacteria bacterium]|nr:30S ribosomal protein S6 [Candidatus Gracilibacteria bacterium]
MANYELMLIINSTLGDDERTACVDTVKQVLKDHKAKIEKEDVWGDKKLAYKINKSERGYYILLDLDLDGTQIKSISKEFNLNTDIWRYMFVNKQD